MMVRESKLSTSIKKMLKDSLEMNWVLIGNVTGYPGVFQSNPHPYLSKPVPASMGTGFRRYG